MTAARIWSQANVRKYMEGRSAAFCHEAEADCRAVGGECGGRG